MDETLPYYLESCLEALGVVPSAPNNAPEDEPVSIRDAVLPGLDENGEPLF